MDRAAALAVGLGAAAGAGARWGIGELLPTGGGGVPWVLLATNTIACGLLGAIVGSGRPAGGDHRRVGASVGFCGGLSTMSTLAVEVAAALRGDDGAPSMLAGAGLLGASVTMGVVAYLAVRSRTEVRRP